MNNVKASERNEILSDGDNETQMKQSNRLQGVWMNSKKNKQCKQISQATKCFCDHEYKKHAQVNVQDKTKLHCKVKNCPCRNYSYVPSQGNLDFKCNCKHSHKLHDPISRRCTFANCGACNRGFQTNYICPTCNSPFAQHELSFQRIQIEQDKSNIINHININQSNQEIKDQQFYQDNQNGQYSFIESGQNNFIQIQENLVLNEGNEMITDAEIERRKALPKQMHLYNEKGRYEKTSLKQENIGQNIDEDDSTNDQIHIKKNWNLKTLVIEENGKQIDVKKQLEKQQKGDNFKNSQFQQKDDYDAYVKSQGKKGILLRLNQELKEERKQLEQKYGHKPIDIQNEVKDLLEQNYIEEDEEVVGGISSYYLFYLPNKYGLEIKKKEFQQQILDTLVSKY